MRQISEHTQTHTLTQIQTRKQVYPCESVCIYRGSTVRQLRIQWEFSENKLAAKRSCSNAKKI